MSASACTRCMAGLFIYCSRMGQTLHRKYLFYTSGMHWNTPIWLDGVDCTGSEDSIVDCKHREWGINDCNHDDDVSIACYDNTTFPAKCECQNSHCTQLVPLHATSLSCGAFPAVSWSQEGHRACKICTAAIFNSFLSRPRDSGLTVINSVEQKLSGVCICVCG